MLPSAAWTRIIWPLGELFSSSKLGSCEARDIDRDHQRAEGEDAETDQNLEGNDDPPAPTGAGGGSGAGGARTSHGGARDYALPGRVTSTRASRRADLRGRCDRWRLSLPPASRLAISPMSPGGATPRPGPAQRRSASVRIAPATAIGGSAAARTAPATPPIRQGRRAGRRPRR